MCCEQHWYISYANAAHTNILAAQNICENKTDEEWTIYLFTYYAQRGSYMKIPFYMKVTRNPEPALLINLYVHAPKIKPAPN